jgi:hypothetical protein
VLTKHVDLGKRSVLLAKSKTDDWPTRWITPELFYRIEGLVGAERRSTAEPRPTLSPLRKPSRYPALFPNAQSGSLTDAALRWPCLPARTRKGCSSLRAQSPQRGVPRDRLAGLGVDRAPIPALRKRGTWLKPELIGGVRHLRGTGTLRHATAQEVRDG